MKRTVLTSLAALLACSSLAAQDFSASIQSILSKSSASTLAVPGAEPGWLFLRKELEHLSVGELASANMAKVNKEGTDPVPAMKKYAEELKALGVTLLVVPIPPKAAIYPEKLQAGLKGAPSLTPFYAKLKAEGIEVLDLETAFKAELASQPTRQLYCATDSHWSPYASQLVARLVAEKLKAGGVALTATPGLTTLPVEEVEFHGDLAGGTGPKEKLPMQRAGLGAGAAVSSVDSDPKSPVVVLGDSHLQVFRRGGNMLATQGGFIDHLQVGLGGAVLEFSMQAGGADGPRVEVARRTAQEPTFWEGKKAVVWVFTAREFTEGKWRVIPAQVKKK